MGSSIAALLHIENAVSHKSRLRMQMSPSRSWMRKVCGASTCDMESVPVRLIAPSDFDFRESHIYAASTIREIVAKEIEFKEYDICIYADPERVQSLTTEGDCFSLTASYAPLSIYRSGI